MTYPNMSGPVEPAATRSATHSGQTTQSVPGPKRLARLERHLHPALPGQGDNFDANGTLPEIRFVRDAVRRKIREYRLRTTTEGETVRYISELFRDCDRDLRSVLFSPSDAAGYRLEFLTSTSRALDVALCRLPSPKTIILSPFEHPAERAVARWHASVTGSTVEQVPFEGRDFHRPWSEQQERIVSHVRKRMRAGVTSPVLVISEVCYATGLIIPVGELLSTLNGQGAALTTIVDGAHSVANLAGVRTQHGWDAYLTSGHKWLFSGEPAGVLVTPVDTSHRSSYDSWSSGVLMATTSVRMVSAVHSGARLFLEPQRSILWSRCHELRRLFVEHTAQKFELVGTGTGLEGTSLVALRPARNMRWSGATPGALRTRLEAGGIRCTVLEIDREEPWLRMGLFYFHDHNTILKCCRLLNTLVQPA